jgi:two-component system, OmpR family, KDP operon response regulator KdpE
MDPSTAHILIVDDETSIRRYLRTTLSAQGYTISEAGGGKEALRILLASRPDLILLDLGLPDMDGIDVTREIRLWSQTPILVLSVRDQEPDKVAALDAGADDYLTKPFSSSELLARMRVALRRLASNPQEKVYRTGSLEVDWGKRRVTLDQQEVSLTPTEYELLLILVRYGGRVITHHQLLRAVWGETYADEMHLLRVNMSNLRRKIEPDPSRPYYIVTEPGVGYRFRSEDS